MDTALHFDPAIDAYSLPLDEIDVSDPRLYQNDTYYPYFERLRREEPVHYRKDGLYGSFWSVTKFKDIMEVAPLADKWRSFGWHTMEIDGHSIPAVRGALEEAAATKGKPSCIVAHTVKGKGVSFMEGCNQWHYTRLTPETYAAAMRELGGEARPAAA